MNGKRLLESHGHSHTMDKQYPTWFGSAGRTILVFLSNITKDTTPRGHGQPLAEESPEGFGADCFADRRGGYDVDADLIQPQKRFVIGQDMVNLVPVHGIEVIDIFDHQLDAKPSDGGSDTFEHEGNPQEGFHRTIAWKQCINFVHN